MGCHTHDIYHIYARLWQGASCCFEASCRRRHLTPARTPCPPPCPTALPAEAQQQQQAVSMRNRINRVAVDEGALQEALVEVRRVSLF